MNPHILSFDLGLKWAWATNADKILFGNDSLGKVDREFNFLHQLQLLLEDELPGWPDAIVYEHAFHQPGYAQDAWYPLVGVLRYVAQVHSLPIIKVSVGTIKKHATGKGGCGKEAMREAMWAKGHGVTTYDEADAVALLLYALDAELVEVGE